MEYEKLISLAEFAAATSLSPSWCARLARAGLIQAVRTPGGGKRWRVPLSYLRDYLAGRRTPGTPWRSATAMLKPVV